MLRIDQWLARNKKGDASGYATAANQPMLNPVYGGQNGWAPNLKEWVSNQAYVRRNLICILLEAPNFFGLMKDHAMWVQTLKSLVELHATSIEGLNATVELAVEGHAVGGAGEMQDEFTNATRTRTEPTFNWVEKYGMPIQTFLYNWITYGMMDPDTKTSLLGTHGDGNRPGDLLADWYSATMLFFEPDPLHKTVLKSWIVTNMFPTTTGEIIGKRDLTSAAEILKLQVKFTGIAQYNLGSIAVAQKILDNINITNANPYLRPGFVQDREANVSNASWKSSANGYQEGAASLVGDNAPTISTSNVTYGGIGG